MANTNSNGASLKNILKVPEIQKRLLFTFLILVVVRFGAQIPIPGGMSLLHGLATSQMEQWIFLI